MKDFASLCILSYKRPQMLLECLESLHATLDFPCEIIINDDSSTNIGFLQHFLVSGKASKLVLSHGDNRGVGRSFQNCLGVAEGEYIFKIDTDIIFKKNWLSTCVNILENNPDVGSISPFNYKHYNPEEKRFNILEERADCFIVDDFVSSVYGFRNVPDQYPLFMPDDGFHQELGKLAITKEDLVSNQGFGLGKSVYVVPGEQGEPVKAKIHYEPKLFYADSDNR